MISDHRIELRLQYLPANQAYAFTFGDSLVDIDGRYLFASLQQARDAARSKHLHVRGDGSVVAIDPELVEDLVSG